MNHLILSLLLVPFVIGAQSFNAKQIFGLDATQRQELMLKLLPAHRKILADSLMRWGSRAAFNQNAFMADSMRSQMALMVERYESGGLLIDKFAAEAGISMLFFIVQFLLTVSFTIWLWKEKTKTILKSSLISSGTIGGLYAFVMFFVF